MISLKFKVLLSYFTIAAVVITGISLFITSRVNKSYTEQAEMISKEIKAQSSLPGDGTIDPENSMVSISQLEEIQRKVMASGMRSQREFRIWMIYINLIALAVFLIATLAIGSVIFAPLGSVSHMLKRMAEDSEGDLTIRLQTKSRDELGKLSEGFNSFMEKLRETIIAIGDNARALNKTSVDLSEMSKSILDMSDEISIRTNSAAAASEEMSNNMTSVSIGTEQMTTTIKEIAQRTARADTIARDAAFKAGNTSKMMDALGEAAREIGDVTEAITKISEQTNLLALNATIEAARAGESGKGFAVVANEIKALAKQTAEATDEIKGKIEAIQSSSEAAIGQIGEISKVISEVNDTVAVIAASMEEQATTTTEIAKNIVHSSTASGKITEDISDIHQSVTGINKNSSQATKHAEELLNLGNNLGELLDHFKV